MLDASIVMRDAQAGTDEQARTVSDPAVAVLAAPVLVGDVAPAEAGDWLVRNDLERLNAVAAPSDGTHGAGETHDPARACLSAYFLKLNFSLPDRLRPVGVWH